MSAPVTDPRMDAEPQISDWPTSYIESREYDFYGLSEEKLLAALNLEHSEMRFGKHIDLNIQQGFYFHRGDGKITIETGSDSGHLIEVLDNVCDGITITRDGDVWWPTSEFAEWYVDRADERVAWVFERATGPWMLTTEHEERKGEHFHFLEVRFLSAADDAAYIAAFLEGAA